MLQKKNNKRNPFGKSKILHIKVIVCLFSICFQFLNTFQKDLHSSPCFGLQVDESTDISVQQVLSITVRYFSPKFNEIRETFLDLIDCNSGTADSLFQLLKNVVESWELDPEKFVGLGTDGAVAMAGCNHSLQSLAKEEYPNLTHMKCSPHSVDLCARDAMDIMPATLDLMKEF